MALTKVRSLSHLPSTTTHHHHHRTTTHLHLNFKLTTYTPKHHLSFTRPIPLTITYSYSSGGGNNNHGNNGNGGGGGNNDNGDDDGEEDENADEKNKGEALVVLAEAGRGLESIPKDIAAAIKDGKIPGLVVERYLELEKSAVARWLLQFGGFKERLLADDLFLTKLGIECGVGIFTKGAAELNKREDFIKELDFVFSDMVMALLADFMLVWLPAPTVSLRGPVAVSAGRFAKLFAGCPDNAFQIAMAGTSYSFLQRIGAIVRNGTKLFGVGACASLVGTGTTNLLINARKAITKSSSDEVHEDIPILATTIAYGTYMSVSSNLRYQVMAGVIEQRILEPLLHQHKPILSAICFALRTGNTFLGSLMWVDFARWVGVQKTPEKIKG